MDYYSVLGVDQNSSQDDIKRAYRKLAMKHHPDRGGDAETLQRINEAYEVLGNPNKKAVYDTPNHTGFDFSNMQGDPFGSFFDANQFSSFFHHDINQRRPKNKDLSISLEVNLEDAYNGKKLFLEIPYPNGQNKTIELDIPQGINHGQKLKLNGMGDNSYQNLLLHFNNKSYGLNIPAGTQPGTKLRMKKLGMPILNTNDYGTLYVVVNCKIPNQLSEKQKQLLQELKDLNNV